LYNLLPNAEEVSPLRRKLCMVFGGAAKPVGCFAWLGGSAARRWERVFSLRGARAFFACCVLAVGSGGAPPQRRRLSFARRSHLWLPRRNNNDPRPLLRLYTLQVIVNEDSTL